MNKIEAGIMGLIVLILAIIVASAVHGDSREREQCRYYFTHFAHNGQDSLNILTMKPTCTNVLRRGIGR